MEPPKPKKNKTKKKKTNTYYFMFDDEYYYGKLEKPIKKNDKKDRFCALGKAEQNFDTSKMKTKKRKFHIPLKYINKSLDALIDADANLKAKDSPQESMYEEPVVDAPADDFVEEPAVDAPADDFVEEPTVDAPADDVVEEPTVDAPLYAKSYMLLSKGNLHRKSKWLNFQDMCLSTRPIIMVKLL